ncbi:MAG: translocation/assembly module TamB [Tannerella sp.]|jgi:hypothetical protein|nr:translocation/assembly module TamB [Tannerella sp.]
MRVWLKRIGIIFLIPVVLLLLVLIVLYTPPVQNVVIKKVVGYVSESAGLEIGFERFRLSFPLNLSVRNAFVRGAESDTLAYLDKLTVEVRLKPLFKGNISVKGVLLEALDLNTGNFLDGMILKGNVGKVYLNADSILLAEERVLLNHIVLSNADVNLFMCDTTVADTAKSEINWCIELKKIELNNVAFACQMPCDSVYLDMQINDAVLSDGFVDLGAAVYRASGFRVRMDEIFYGTDLMDATSGLDFSHIKFTEIDLALDSLYYGGSTDIYATIRECSARERSGLVVESVTGRIKSDSVQIEIPSFLLETAFSTIQMQALVPWASVRDKEPEGRLSLNVKALIDKEDALLIIGNASKAFQTYYPDTIFTIDAFADGNMADVTLRKFDAELPGAFHLNLAGSVSSLTDEHLRTGKIDCSVKTQDMDFVAGMFPSMLQQRFQIPDNMSLNGHLTIDKGRYSTEMVLKESMGKIRFSGNYDVFRKSYEAYLKIDSLEPIHFMPDDSIMWLTASVHAKGLGTDIYRSSTQAEIEGRINDIYYGNSSISDVTVSGSLKNNHVLAELQSAYPLIKGRILIDGDIEKEKIKGMLIADIDSLDFYGLKITDSPLSSSFQIFSEIETDLDKTHSLDITLGNWSLVFENQTVRPKMLTLAFHSNADTTRASFYAGDMNIRLTGNAGLETLVDKLTYLSGDVEKQLTRDSTVNVQELRPHFPDMSVHINAERDNPLYNFLQGYNTFFETFNLDATISPEEGLNINGTVLALVKDTLKIDTIRFNVWQDTLGIQYKAGVVKKRFRNQEPFKADANGYIRANDADILASYVNGKGEKGLYLGVNAKKTSDGFDFHFYPEQSVIAFLPFTISKDNYFHFKNMKEMHADLRLEGRSHSSLWIHSDHSDESMREMMIELNHINLEEISTGFTDLPSLKGMLNATFRYEPMDNSFMIIADGNVDDLYYENGRIGELLLNATYMPVEKGTHQIDMHVFRDMSEISSLSVLYQEGRYEGKIDGIISVNQLPLNMFDALIPDQMMRLDGSLNGNFDISGTDKKPVLSGALQLEKGSAYVVPSSTTLYFDDQQIKMTKNKVDLDKYKIYVQKDNPLVIDGIIDATNTSRPMVDLKMSASNLQLIDAKKTSESLAYGKLSININSTLKGTPQSLRMRGSLRILGNTNLTYVVPDSQLDVEDNFSGLVTFTYFGDTLPRRTDRPVNFVRGTRNAAVMTGTDVLMTISIDPVVRIRIDLDEEQSNFVELKGGGDLSLQYTQQGDISLNGRYTLSDGTIRYSIPVIPLTDFSIKDGSYVEWSGDPMNPFLNISAYTRVRSSVNLDGQSRMVDFNAGIRLRENLENVSVQFLLEAPTDAVIQNLLTSLGTEEQGKQAVSLLVTGVFLASEGAGTDNMDVSAALSSLLQREIKNMLGSLFGDVPFSFDINTYDGTQGMGRRVDYIGRFYKDFFNERLNTTLGLRYSTNDPVFGNGFFLDDISFEYRLDTDGSRAVKVFRSKEYENMFEGEITKIGASFALRRKVKRFKDLFNFRRQDVIIVNEEDKKKISGNPAGESEHSGEENENAEGVNNED